MSKIILFVYIFKLIFALEENYKGVVDSIDNLPYDAEERLSSNIFLTPSNCVNWSNEGINSVNSDFRDKYIINGEFKELLGLSISSKVEGCWGICVDRGTTKDLIEHPMIHHVYSEATQDIDMTTWYRENCQQAEIGFVSYHPTPLNVYWIAPWGEKLHRAILQKGEKYTFWSKSWLGHQFELVDTITKEIVMERTVEFNGIHAVGEKPTLKKPLSMEKEIKNTLSHEWARSRRVTRTFTELGFNLGKLPRDLWSSISAYYYNNQNNRVREEWESKGVFVNWWEVDAYMIQIPMELKRVWQSQLKLLVESWAGVELENTDIYGLRRYEEGARLLHHVDREETHAASLIINVAQGGVRTPWTVEIYDLADRLHEVVMEPGDIVYYESAKCLHGRNTPLNGEFYVNLFAHYRPVGDDRWYLKPNPDGTPDPLIDIGDCSVVTNTESLFNNNRSVSCSKESLPFLSTTMHTINNAGDLMDWWRYSKTRNTDETYTENGVDIRGSRSNNDEL